MSNQAAVCQVAVAVPLRRTFDYVGQAAPGTRVLVPFGRRQMVGVVVARGTPRYAGEIKPITRVLDETPAFAPPLRELLEWASHYYHHPIGEVMQTALPPTLRVVGGGDPTRELYYLPNAEHADLTRAPQQRRVWEFLQQRGAAGVAELDESAAPWRPAMRALLEKKLVRTEARDIAPEPAAASPAPRRLNAAQQAAVDEIAARQKFETFLLQGVTGSGKTEVYLEAARAVLARGRRVLFLLPEIALTPQLIARVQAGLNAPLGVLHSGLSRAARHRNWHLARRGKVGAVLGARSAVFAPLEDLGLIVVDEEHDASYKQHDGFRYNARDLAIKRASLADIPVVLGSATPFLESRRAAQSGRYRQLRLPQRYGAARPPSIALINLQQFAARDALSQPLLDAIALRLERGEQSLIFLNRRGYAPVVHCAACDWRATCRRCDARLTWHQSANQFRCHHCDARRATLDACPDCGAKLIQTGAGTQRAVAGLAKHFPHARILRLDRDAVGTHAKLEVALEQIKNREIDIVVGTQLIAKSHDFPNVTLVGVVNADQGLFCLDFRAGEQMFQQLVQVAGRAGRAERAGEVLIQTQHPDNPTLQYVVQHDYDRFADACLAERERYGFPPFQHLALWRAESPSRDAAYAFLSELRGVGARVIAEQNTASVEIMDVVASPMEKLAGRFRCQLLVRAKRRGELHDVLRRWLRAIDAIPNRARARWSLDVDPFDLY